MVRGRKWAAFAAVALGAVASSAPAAVLYTDDFSLTTNGNLVTDQTTGQARFVQTGTVVTNPIQVNNGIVILGTVSGQDVSAPFNSVGAGNSIYTSAVIKVSNPQA